MIAEGVAPQSGAGLRRVSLIAHPLRGPLRGPLSASRVGSCRKTRSRTARRQPGGRELAQSLNAPDAARRAHILEDEALGAASNAGSAFAHTHPRTANRPCRRGAHRPALDTACERHCALDCLAVDASAAQPQTLHASRLAPVRSHVPLWPTPFTAVRDSPVTSVRARAFTCIQDAAGPPEGSMPVRAPGGPVTRTAE